MRHVLLIERERFLLALLTRKLEGSGFRVSATPDAARGWRLAWARAPDLIVLEPELRLGGARLSERLRGDPRTAHIPLILLGGDTPGLAKPFSPSRLLDLAHLSLSAPRSEALRW